jgi:hypothetical protein
VRIAQPPGASPAFTRAWYAWIACFFLIEGSALARHRPQDTLSDHIWAWFGIPQHTAPQRSIRTRRMMLLAGVAWLAAHLLSGDDV